MDFGHARGTIGGMSEPAVFPDVVLTTDRLILRPFTAADADTVQLAGADPVTQTWLPLPRPYLREHALEWCRDLTAQSRTSGRGLVRAVEAGGTVVGAIDLKRTDWASRVAEIGYWTAPASRGRGLMAAATTALARWTLDAMAFARVELRIATGNLASVRVAEKAGFTREGVARSAGYVHGGRVDLAIYSLIRADLGLPELDVEGERKGASA